MKKLGMVFFILFVASCSFHEPKSDWENSKIGIEVPPTFSNLKEAIFEPRCVKCHSPTGKARHFPFGSLEDFLSGPEPLIVLNDPLRSRLYIAISRTDEDRMPPPGKGDPLSSEEIDYIRLWIENGAPATVLDASSY